MKVKVKVYFLRHGIAADAQSWNGSDASRPLTDEGRERMQREAKALSKIGLTVDAIVMSPLLRAKETAEIVAERLSLRKRLIEDARLGGGFDTTQLAALLQKYPDADSIMLVGHEPDFSAMVGAITAGRIDLKKGGLACVELTDPASMRGELLWLVPPKILAG